MENQFIISIKPFLLKSITENSKGLFKNLKIEHKSNLNDKEANQLHQNVKMGKFNSTDNECSFDQNLKEIQLEYVEFNYRKIFCLIASHMKKGISRAKRNYR